VSAGGEAHFADGHFKRTFAGCIERAIRADAPRGHVGVVVAACLLNAARGLHALANSLGSFCYGIASELFIRNGGNFDMDIDAVQQRSADLSQVALNDARCAAAFARGIGIEAAWAGVHVTKPVEVQRESAGRGALAVAFGEGTPDPTFRAAPSPGLLLWMNNVDLEVPRGGDFSPLFCFDDTRCRRLWIRNVKVVIKMAELTDMTTWVHVTKPFRVQGESAGCTLGLEVRASTRNLSNVEQPRFPGLLLWMNNVDLEVPRGGESSRLFCFDDTRAGGFGYETLKL